MQDPSRRPTSIRFLALALLAGTAASAYLVRYCISISSGHIEHDLAFTHREMSWVFASFMAGYLVGQIPGGAMGVRIGTRAGLSLLIAAWSVFTACSAFSQSLVPLVAAQFAVGLAQAGMVPISSVAVKEWFPASRRGLPSAVISAAMSVGGVAAMWLTGKLLSGKWIVSLTDAWQQVLIGYGLLGIGWAVVFAALFRRRPDDHPWANEAEARLVREPEARVDVAASEKPAPADGLARGVFLTMLTSLSVWALAGQWFFRSVGYQFFARWFPAFLKDRYGMPVDDSGFYSSCTLLGVAIGSLAGGFLVDRLLRASGKKWVSRNLLSVVTLFLCALCLAASELCPTGREFVALMSLGAVFSGMSMPTGWAATIDVSGKQTALLFAVMNMFATLAGIVAPPVVGYLLADIQDSGGTYASIVYLHAAIYAIAGICWLFVDPNRAIDQQDAASPIH